MHCFTAQRIRGPRLPETALPNSACVSPPFSLALAKLPPTQAGLSLRYASLISTAASSSATCTAWSELDVGLSCELPPRCSILNLSGNSESSSTVETLSGWSCGFAYPLVFVAFDSIRRLDIVQICFPSGNLNQPRVYKQLLLRNRTSCSSHGGPSQVFRDSPGGGA